MDTMVTLILYSLLVFCIKELCTKECQENKCGAGYQCIVDGEKNRCLKPPHCTPESTAKLVENDLTCVCDTMRLYWGENYLECKKKENPCPSLKSLDQKSGECICETNSIEMNGTCVKQDGHPATPGTNLDTDDQGSSSNVLVIVGSTIGAVGLVGLVIGILVACYKKRKRSIDHSSRTSSDPEANVTEPLTGATVDPAPNGTPANGLARPPSESASSDYPNGNLVAVYNITAGNVQIGDNNIISNGHAVEEQ